MPNEQLDKRLQLVQKKQNLLFAASTTGSFN